MIVTIQKSAIPVKFLLFFIINCVGFSLFGQENVYDSIRSTQNLNDTSSFPYSLKDSASSTDSAMISFDSVTYEDPVPGVSEVSILVDYGKTLGQFVNFEEKYEAAFAIVLRDKIQLIGEYGYASLTPKNNYKNADYESKGEYVRLGLSYFSRASVKNNISIGFRYAISSDFEHIGTYHLRAPEIDDNFQSGRLQRDYQESFGKSNLTATWYELVLQTETKLWKVIWAGMQFRFKYLRQPPTISEDEIDVRSIPGYGLRTDQTVPAVNLYLKFRVF